MIDTTGRFDATNGDKRLFYSALDHSHEKSIIIIIIIIIIMKTLYTYCM